MYPYGGRKDPNFTVLAEGLCGHGPSWEEGGKNPLVWSAGRDLAHLAVQRKGLDQNPDRDSLFVDHPPGSAEGALLWVLTGHVSVLDKRYTLACKFFTINLLGLTDNVTRTVKCMSTLFILPENIYSTHRNYVHFTVSKIYSLVRS